MFLRPLARLLCATALFASPLALAADPATALRQIHAARLGVLETAAAFQGYQGSEGDPRRGKELHDKLAATQARISTLDDALKGLGVDAELSAAHREWASAIAQLHTASAALGKDGFAEFAVMDKYMQETLATHKTLGVVENHITEASGFKPAPVVVSLRAEALLMQLMTTRYLERSNSQFGASYRTDQTDEDTIDVMAQRFGKELETLAAGIPPGHAQRVRLDKVRTNWQFLEKSYLNYTEQNVPSLADRFSKDIITALSEMAMAFEAGS